MADSSAASTRAFAVARLKRAASLPRMKDGRRPPMHPEAGVSEGERPSPDPQGDSDILDTPPAEAELEPELEPEPEAEQEQEQEIEHEPPEPSTTPGPALSPPVTPGPEDATTSSDKKKRRRSRSRGRGSRDYKAKAAAQARAAALTPVPGAAADSSADDGEGSFDMRPTSPFFMPSPSPAVFAPIPSPLALWTAQRAFAAATPEPGMFYPPGPISSPGTPYPVTSPSTPAPGTGVPTLQDLTQHVFVRGLQRSNSAAAQLMLSKLQTPGSNHTPASPTTTPPPNALFRSNTVGGSPAAGGDRSAARQNLLMRLNSRRRADAAGDESQPSGAEDAVAPVISPRRKRRSKRASQPRGEDVDVVDDREEMSSATSPLDRIAPLPPTRNRTSIERGRDDALARLLGSPVEPRPQSRGVVVEDDLDGPEYTPTHPRSSGHRSPLPSGLPATPPPRGTGVSKLSGNSDDSGMSVPLKLSDTIHGRHELFPSSPFATPLRERDEDLGAGLGGVAAGHEPMPELRWGVDEREVSWVDPEPQSSDESEYEDDGDNEGEGENDGEVNGTFGPVQAESSPEYEHDTTPAADDSADYTQPDITVDTTISSTDYAQPQETSRRSSQASVEIEHPSSPEPDHIRGPPSQAPSHHSHESQLSHRGPLVEPASPVSPSRSGAPSPFAPVIEHTRSGSRAEMTSPLPHTVHRQISNESADSRFYPARLSVASPSPGPNEWDSSQGQVLVERERKEKEAGGWEKVKRAFIRTGTPVRRRSRSGSMRERGNTDSSVSRESRGSMSNNSKDALSPYPASPAQTPGASPNLPLPQHTEMLARYAATDAKLFPFPGIIPGLQRLNVSSPDVSAGSARPMNVSSPDVSAGYFSPTGSGEAAEGTGMGMGRERKLSHQASDTRLLPKFAAGPISPSHSGSSTDGGTSGTWRAHPVPPPLTSSTSANGNGNGNGNAKLPHTRDGVRKWLSAKKIFTSSSGSSADSPNGNGHNHERSASRAAGSVQISGPVLQAHDPAKGTVQHPLLVEMFAARERERQGGGSGSGSGGEGWEDVDRTPTGGARPLNGITSPEPSKLSMRELEVAYGEEVYPGADPTPEPSSPAVTRQESGTPYTASPHSRYAPGSPPDPVSTTPDPMSSLDDVSRSQSTLSSDAEGEGEHTADHRRSPEPVLVNAQGPAVLARLEEALHTLPEPPRKLLLSSPVLQVANADTVKDRFLFLFTDLLVIAKPLAPEADADSASRRFVVKSAARLRDLKFAGERAPPPTLSSADPRIRMFVQAFGEDPQAAIRTLLSKTGGGLDTNAGALGRLLFRTLELDRARLGEYLVARGSRPVLKAYIGQLALEGLPVHVALRAFLQSVHVPPSSGAAEYLLDAFAGRWYDANRDGVAFDRDLAVRLVRALAQLDDVLHGGSFASSRRAGAPHNVTARDFRDAFRRFDARRAVPDSVLDEAHTSVRRAALGHAPRSTPDATISFKRPVPARLTFKVQSEPVIVRLPAPDAGLTISLHGSGLTFDPPTLTFARSPEASFRITGSSLGPRSIAFILGGPRSAFYGGLSPCAPLVVERAFMRNTFQVAFEGRKGEKRRYMFGVDDAVLRHNWVASLRRQVEVAKGLLDGEGTFAKAAEEVGFRVLLDTLLEEVKGHSHSGSTASFGMNGRSSVRPLELRRRADAAGHTRSKSRSQIYARHGAGRVEAQELGLVNGNGNGWPNTEDEDGEGGIGARVWTGRELQVVCVQNSAIVGALGALGVGG
ncbi:hypothetical protein PENSPDRAFT_735323 [Peniophora sp. CONT]|nr:hypothetical protein PENSPDRAFT_735323 [Peniophora sp. CONT]